MFRRLRQRVACVRHCGRVAFEILNEPGGAMDAAAWNRIFARQLAVVRRLNPTRPVVVGVDESAAAKGAISPNSSSRTASAEEISEVAQPNSFCRGRSSTPGAPTAPAVTSMVRKVTAATAQP